MNSSAAMQHSLIRKAYSIAALMLVLFLVDTESHAKDTQLHSAEAYSNRGAQKVEAGDLKGAIEDYAQVIKLKPNDALAYYNRGTTKRDSGDSKGAIEDLDQAIKLNPSYAKAYKRRSIAKEKLGDKKGAIEDAEQALKLEQKP